MKINLIALSLTAVLLTGCGLTAGNAPSDSTTAGTDTLSGLTGGTVPSVTDPLPVSEPQPKENQPQYILAQSANAMLETPSYEYTKTSVSNFADTQITSITEAVIFPLKGDGMITKEEAGFRNTTYMKDNMMYREDSATGSWIYLPMTPPEDTPVKIHERVNDFMEVLPTEEGYVLNSTRPLDLLEFYSLTGIEEKEQYTIKILKDQGVIIETMVEIWLDKEYRFVTVIHDQVTTSQDVSTGELDEYEYRNYDQAPEVVIPDEVLTEAVEYQP